MSEIQNNYNGTLDLSATGASKVIPAGHTTNASIQTVMADTHTATGTLIVQGSNDRTNWITITFVNPATGSTASSFSISSGVAVNDMFSISDLNYLYLRLSYTRTSGSGTITFTVASKKVGGR